MNLAFGIGAVLVRRDWGGSRLGWFLLGAALGPVGLLLALSVGGRWCPKCDARIPRSATQCPDCRASIEMAERSPSARLVVPR
jgi:hypothetical protein